MPDELLKISKNIKGEKMKEEIKLTHFVKAAG